MKNLALAFAALIFCSCLPPGAHAQMGMRPVDITGFWSPSVGSGAAYNVQSKQNNMRMELTIVGKESVDGKDGYWMESSGQLPQGNGEFVSKMLMVVDGPKTHVQRMIMQMPGRPPMEMPAQMMQRGQSPDQESDIRVDAQDLGKETVTTPAGSFECEHYKTKKGDDVWLSDKVHPWGMVKMTNGDTQIMLAKVISDARDKVTGEPQQFNPLQLAPRQ